MQLACLFVKELFNLVYIFNNENLTRVGQELHDFCMVCHQVEDLESNWITNGLCRIRYAVKMIITILNLEFQMVGADRHFEALMSIEGRLYETHNLNFFFGRSIFYPSRRSNIITKTMTIMLKHFVINTVLEISTTKIPIICSVTTTYVLHAKIY